MRVRLVVTPLLYSKNVYLVVRGHLVDGEAYLWVIVSFFYRLLFGVIPLCGYNHGVIPVVIVR